MPNNVFNLPITGKPIALSDAGIYYAINRNTGAVNNVFHLHYDDEDWLLYQLKNTAKNGEMGWIILADHGDYPLKSCEVSEINYHFDKPAYAEPKGAWQLMRNTRYGFGKFTPIHPDESTQFAMVLFSNTPNTNKHSINVNDTNAHTWPSMLVPLLIQKADDQILQSFIDLPH